MKESNEKTTNTREKSEAYPSVTVGECVRFIRDVDTLGGKFVPYERILAMMGIKSPYTKSFLYRLSTAKQFGFITTNAQRVQITDEGKKILYPAQDEEKRRLLIEAFQRPPLYKKLINRFSGKPLPPEELLSNILLTEYGIVKSVKDLAASCFLKSAGSLGLLETGILCLGAPASAAAPETAAPVPVAAPAAPGPAGAEKPEAIQAKGAASGYNFVIPTLGQKTANLCIPAGITKKDIDFIRQYIEQMIPTVLDNLKEELT